MRRAIAIAIIVMASLVLQVWPGLIRPITNDAVIGAGFGEADMIADAHLSVGFDQEESRLGIESWTMGEPGTSPGYFTENIGQLGNKDILYYSNPGPLQVGFSKNTVLYKFVEKQPHGQGQTWVDGDESTRESGGSLGVLVRLTFAGANSVLPRGRGSLSQVSNFLHGSAPEQWFTNVRSFKEVIYEDIYDGVDLVYGVGGDHLKYEFTVNPHGDPSRIVMAYEGIESLEILPEDELTLSTAIGAVHDSIPYSYQGIGGERSEVFCRFEPRGLTSIGFRCDEWDSSQPLTIDPLVYSTFLGGSTADEGSHDVAIDSQGNVYLTGYTDSNNFPTTPGVFDIGYNGGGGDVYVVKVDASGSSLVFSTFLGGSDDDWGYDVEVDSANDVYVTGRTYSPDFPTTGGAYDMTLNGGADAFVTKLNSSGSALIYSTFLGGGLDDWTYSVAVDSALNACVAGRTQSAGFPTTANAYDAVLNGGWDAFVTKLNRTGGMLLFSSFLGSPSTDVAGGIVVDSMGYLYVGGQTYSNSFPITPGAYDGTLNGATDSFASKLDPTSGELVYSTFLGGSGDEAVDMVDIDTLGNLYLTGYTTSSNFPTTPGAFDVTYGGTGGDAFATKLKADGKSLVYSTYLGGSSADHGNSINVHSSGEAYIAGWTSSGNFPTTPGAFDTTYNGGSTDSFVTRLDVAGGVLMYSSYIGGSGDDGGPTYSLGTQAIIDTNRNIYVSGWTSSSNFPTTVGAYDTSYNGGGSDAFLSKLNTTLIGLSIETSPSGLAVTVDGLTHTAPYSFLCGQGTSHLINVSSPQMSTGTRYLFVAWSDGGGQSHTINCDTPKTVTAYFTTDFEIVVDTTPQNLQVSVDGNIVVAPFVYWCDARLSVTLDVPSPQAGIFDRYTFESWSDSGPQMHTVPCADPASYTANFTAEYLNMVATSPMDLIVEVDGVPYQSPYMFWCTAGSSYTVNASAQVDLTEIRYTFLDWSDGGAQNHTVICNGMNFYVAIYAVDYLTTLKTSPTGLELQLDGTLHSAPYSFWCSEGSIHVINVSSPQTILDTSYTYTSWSDGGAISHSIACGAPQNITASFDTGFRLVIDTSPSGYHVTYDGVNYTAPLVAWCDAGSSHGVDVPSPQVAGQSRFLFSTWSDGGSKLHQISCDAPMTLVATLSEEFEITVMTSPEGLGIVVDSAGVTAPYVFWCPSMSMPTLEATSPVVGGGTRNVFYSWSDGGARAHQILCDSAKTFEANFTTEFEIEIDTMPSALQVEVDDNPFTAPYIFWCNAGSRRVLNMTSPQVSGPLRYSFVSWSDLDAQRHSIVCDGPATYVALLTTEYRTVVTSAPAGLELVLDGNRYSSRWTFWCDNRSTHMIDVTSPQVLGSILYTYDSWSDGGQQAHLISCTSPLTYTAIFDGVSLKDFNISASPATRLTVPGGTTDFVLNVTGIYGYDQPAVAISATGLPAGFSASCIPASINPPGTCLLTVTAAPSVAVGAYVLNITGSNGTRSHDVSVRVQIADFSLQLSASTILVEQGSGGAVTVSVNAFGGFSWSVVFSADDLPLGVGAGFSPVAVSISGSSTLSLQVKADVEATTYHINVTGTSGILSHRVSLQLEVMSKTPPRNVENIPVWVWLLIILLIALVVVLAVLLILAKRRKKENGELDETENEARERTPSEETNNQSPDLESDEDT